MKKILVLSIALPFIFACNSTSKVAKPSSSIDLSHVKDKYPGYTAAQYSEGKTLYESKCTTCHAMKSPKGQSEASWPKLVANMAEMSNGKGMVISATEEQAILKYLVTTTLAK
jgi:cytochrome c5